MLVTLEILRTQERGNNSSIWTVLSSVPVSHVYVLFACVASEHDVSRSYPSTCTVHAFIVAPIRLYTRFSLHPSDHTRVFRYIRPNIHAFVVIFIWCFVKR